MMVNRKRDESGVALLVVLLAITLLTITVVEFTYSTQVETRLARGTRNSLQAYYLARSGVNLAEAILIRDTQLSGAVDSELDIWAQPLPPLPLGDGTIMLRVQDEARFLNVNALAKEIGDSPDLNPERRAFTGIFSILGFDPRIRSALIDWLDPNDRPEKSPPGAEQPFYLGLQPPVAVRDDMIADLRELLGVRDMTPEILAKLSNFVTVVFDPDEKVPFRVNINTAPAEVLMALSPGLAGDPAAVQGLLTARAEQAFNGEGSLRERAPRAAAILEADDTTAGGTIWSDVLAYASTYFRIEAVGTVAGTSRGVTTVVRRSGSPAQVTRISWSPRVSQLALTTLPPSDFLEALPPLVGG